MDFIELIKKEGLRRGLSNRTILTYCTCVKKFFIKCQKDPKKVKKADIQQYLDFLLKRGASGSTLNVYLNALKFLFEGILGKRLLFRIKFSKIPKTLPSVLTKEEVLSLFSAISNERHKLIIKLIYSAGLRVSELTNLRVSDLELSKNIGWVRKGKGNKDRPFIISQKLKEDIIRHIDSQNLEYGSLLFRGRNGRLSPRTISVIIKKAAKKAKIRKNVHPHTLRHSFTTHLIEDGYDVSTIQHLLGHNSSQTTMKYIHAASPRIINVRSPYDSLEN